MATINFLADLERITKGHLHSLGHTQATGNLRELLYLLLNVDFKNPPVLLWNIKYSKEIEQQCLSENVKLGLQNFLRKATSGENLTPYLSKQSANPNQSDFMLCDWRIFHFHLGIVPDKNNPKFIERTKELLFVITDPGKQEMYLIDIRPHDKAFTNQDLLGIINNNWPEIIYPYSLSRITSLPVSISNQDIHDLRKAGINPIIKIPSGSVLMSIGGGISSTGKSRAVNEKVDRLINDVVQLEEYFMRNRSFIESYFKNKYNQDWNTLIFKILSFDLIEIEEVSTGEKSTEFFCEN